MRENKFIKTVSPYVMAFLSAIMAGVCISFGGAAYLASSSKEVGALFFVVGLFMVLFFDFNLYTGRICFALDKKPKYIINLILIWLGNFAGAVLSGLLLSLTRLDSLQQKCLELVNAKLNDSLISLFVLGILCNMLIFVAVYGFKNGDSSLKKGLALFFGVSVFVLCGFEHCVADMFYFTFANAWSWHALLCIFIIALGNTVGGLLMASVIKIRDVIKNKQSVAAEIPPQKPQNDSENTEK